MLRYSSVKYTSTPESKEPVQLTTFPFLIYAQLRTRNDPEPEKKQELEPMNQETSLVTET